MKKVIFLVVVLLGILSATLTFVLVEKKSKKRIIIKSFDDNQIEIGTYKVANYSKDYTGINYNYVIDVKDTSDFFEFLKKNQFFNKNTCFENEKDIRGYLFKDNRLYCYEIFYASKTVLLSPVETVLHYKGNNYVVLFDQIYWNYTKEEYDFYDFAVNNSMDDLKKIYSSFSTDFCEINEDVIVLHIINLDTLELAKDVEFEVYEEEGKTKVRLVEEQS